ncbi:MAG: D-alanyl-D-alanine carboxypeptidase/D-alanyl-D-alanine-endopeptidase [Bryobacterales bacterium]|nr:D-alanyl-D-alanine carboxypeptidase/D-alanyl-D-alanine-endopeptidase [Bryobacterales bacterium]
MATVYLAMRRGILVIALLCALPASGAPKKKKQRPLAERVERIIAETPALQRAHVGVRVVDLSGKVYFERNAQSWFVPASNTKLYSTALALTRLGADYRMTTRVTAAAAPEGGVIRGDVRLVGGGDPSLSGRVYPYDKEKEWNDIAPGIEDLADQLARRGVTRIEGAVAGDDTAYVHEPFPDGWSIDDPLYEYGAPVSALTLQDNSIRLEVRPGETAGEAAEAYLSADVGQLVLVPEVMTVAAGERGRIRLERPANTNELRVYGTIAAGAKPYSALLAIPEPALYAAQVFREALIRRGIAVRDPAVARHRVGAADPGPDYAEVLAERKSRPLAELVQVVNKVSQNLHAELLLREAGRQGKAFGSVEAGLASLREFLTGSVGLRKEDVNFEDGSGLSRLTLLTPEATTKLLVFMAGSAAKEAWVASLPVGGEDGTIGRRFTGPEKGQVRAKTGTLSHVSALGGYLDHPKRGRMAFTVLLNNYNTASAEARQGIDKLVGTLLE